MNTTSKLVDELILRNDIHIIDEYVSTELEITEIYERILKKGDNKAILFKNNGTNFPLLINAYGSEERMNLILDTQYLDEIGKRILVMLNEATKPATKMMEKLSKLPLLKDVASWLPSRSAYRAACQKVIMTNVDLDLLPILKCWPYDGGKFITLPSVHTLNPENGVTNVGMYRMQQIDKKSTAMHWHLHKDGAKHYEMYKKRGEIMPVTVTLGGDPIFAYCASAPLPENIDEYLLAGFLRKKRVNLVKSLTNDIWIPSNVDIVIEGYIDPQEELFYEGPFGDHTGYYSLADFYPKFHVTMITHRVDAIYPTTVVGVPPQEDRWLGKATERIFLTPLRIAIAPGVIDMNLPYQAGFHNLAIIQIENSFPSQSYSVMSSLWGAGQMMFNKIMLVVPSDVNPHDEEAVWNSLKNVLIERDIMFTRGPADVLDHAGRRYAQSGKIGIDACNENPYFQKPIFKSEVFEKEFPNITYDDSLCQRGIPAIFFGIEEETRNNPHKVLADIMETDCMENISFIIFFDNNFPLTNRDILIWQLAGNIDPQYDCTIVETDDNFMLLIDACSKVDHSDFTRNWPNVIAMDDKTIESINNKWKIIFGEEAPSSPSLELKRMVKNEGAVAK